MERVTYFRPRIARETRLLVTTALLAVLALWMLARLRFPAAPAEPRAISGILASLGTGADFDGLATQVARARALVGPYLLTAEFDIASADGVTTARRPALRIGGDLAAVQMPPGGHLRPASGMTLVAYDTASQLAVVRVPVDPSTRDSSLRIRIPQPSQYIIASAVYPEGVALRPVFLADLAPVDAPLWAATAWAVPNETGLVPGSFLFTRDGEFAGMAISHRDSLGFVSGDTVLAEADRLVSRTAAAGDYGVQVEALTPALQRALGTLTGVVVTWVDPNGPAGEALVVSDVIEAANGSDLPSLEHWQRHVASAAAGERQTLRVFRAGVRRTIEVSAVPLESPAEDESASIPIPFGARTRLVRGLGAEVLSIDRHSLAARSGLKVGDFITFLGATSMPGPVQIADLTESLREGRSLLMGVRRGDQRHLLVLER
jgi:hypothetical protein